MSKFSGGPVSVGRGLQLDVYRGHEKIETLQLTRSKTTYVVGREGNVDVKLRHQSISRAHAEISVEGNHVFVTDTGSSHGSYVDGKRLAPNDPTPLLPGGKVKFGGSSRIYKLSKKYIAKQSAAKKAKGPPDEQVLGPDFSTVSSVDNRARLDELAKAFKFLLRPGERRSYEMRPDGYVQLTDIMDSGALTNYNATEKEIVDMASTVAAHVYELVELSGVFYIRLRLEGGTVVGPLVEVLDPVGEFPVLVHAMMFKDWNSVRSTGLQARMRSPVVFISRIPQGKEEAPGCNGAPQIIIEMDVERMVAKGLKLYLDGHENIVCAGRNHDGAIPVSFFKKCYNAKNKSDLLDPEDIDRVRKEEDAAEAKQADQKAKADAEAERGLVRGATVRYKLTGEKATIMAVHMEDLPPYYTISLSNGREKQTTADRLEVPATDEDGEYSPVISPRSKKRQKKEEEAEEEQARKEKVDDFFGLGLANMKKAGGPPARKKKRLAI